MQKVTLIINGASFEITLADEYVEIFKRELAKDLSLIDSNSVKTLLYAFLRKNYEILELKKEIESIAVQLEDNIAHFSKKEPN